MFTSGSWRHPFRHILLLATLCGIVPALLATASGPEEAPILDRLTAEQLREQLLQVPEVALAGGKEEQTELVKEVHAKAAAPARDRTAPTALDYQARRWEALGLTCRPESDRLLFHHEAEYLENNARLLRLEAVVALPGEGATLLPAKVTTLTDFRRLLETKSGEPLPHHLTPALNQLLQSENETSRALLVAGMTEIDTNYSTCCLTERALYDLSPTVRAAAIKAIAGRPREEVRPMLLDALRHPWAPAAQHAAEALVALQDRDAVPALTKLLDQPDPRSAFLPPGEKPKPMVREMVRVNHLRNCLLCHAPSNSNRDLVSAPVPNPAEPLVEFYYGMPRPSRPAEGDIFVRADVTYLREDFAVTQPVAKAAPWPGQQRFDYLVRTRPATAAEVAAAEKPTADHANRQAVRFAIEGLQAARK